MIHPLSLSQAQLDVVLDGANRVSPQWRSRFLDNVADRLIGLDTISDDTVQEAVRHMLTRMGVEAKP